MVPSEGEIVVDERAIMWPNPPQGFSTLLAAVGVASMFVGLGTLMAQGWAIWLGLLLATGILASHVIRYRQAQQVRQRAQESLQARLMSRCRIQGGPAFLRLHSDTSEEVVLLLTDNGLHVAHCEPLEIFATIPFYDIDDTHAGPRVGPKDSQERAAPPALKSDVLNLAVRRSGQTVHHLTFSHFEPHAPATAWAHALTQQRTYTGPG